MRNVPNPLAVGGCRLEKFAMFVEVDWSCGVDDAKVEDRFPKEV